VVLWAIFAVELAGLVTLGVQRSVVERRGGGEPWLIRGAEPALERALEAGERRQDENERLPLGEFENRQRLQNLALAASAGMSLPVPSRSSSPTRSRPSGASRRSSSPAWPGPTSRSCSPSSSGCGGLAAAARRRRRRRR
jgi:hypothetical protein